MLLVDPSYTRQLRGRPKTDRRDCQWIYRLHSVGLLAPAFRPDEKTCQLRADLRQRATLIRYASQHVQHMQKALEQMNLKLTEILSDITGVTGRAIIRAILRGTRAPEKLAMYRDKQCMASEAEIARALTGSYREEHLFALKLAYEAWQFSLRQVEKVDDQIAPIGADEVRSGLAGADAAGASAPEDQRAAVRRADGVVLRGRARPDGDRRDQRADRADGDQRDRPGCVAVRECEEVL